MTQPSEPIALVTGASSGIGKATASLLAIHGFRVFGTSRRPESEPQRPYELLPMDVRSDASVKAATQIIFDKVGRIDLLVNNAGYAQAGAIEETSLAEVQAQFETNVFGMLRVTDAVLPSMRRQGFGRIINISSVFGYVAPPHFGVYAGSKFAVEGLSESLRSELRPFNIHVSLVVPGFVKTNLVSQLPVKPLADYKPREQIGLAFVDKGVERGMDPERIAQTILHIATVAHPRLRYLIGRETHLLLTSKRLLPEPVFEWMRRRAFPAEATSTLQPQFQSR